MPSLIIPFFVHLFAFEVKHDPRIREEYNPFFSFLLARRRPTMRPQYQGHSEDGLEKVKIVTCDCNIEGSPHHTCKAHKKGTSFDCMTVAAIFTLLPYPHPVQSL